MARIVSAEHRAELVDVAARATWAYDERDADDPPGWDNLPADIQGYYLRSSEAAVDAVLDRLVDILKERAAARAAASVVTQPA